jgi:hypothetical protein
MLDWLRKARMVRRDAQPEADLLGELFRAAAPKLICPKCGLTGLVVRPIPEEDDEAWGLGRACQQCGRPIARERLEAVSDAKLCANCQRREDNGELTAAPEYCPRCGNLMTVRQTRTAGITRYTLACSKCRG